MAIYRQVHISFWQDPFIEELDYKQKYFYLYLLTNSKTRQCGCYEISKKLISYETGLNLEDIDNLLKFFIEKNKIAVFENEILLKNWLNHNSFKSSTIKTCIEKELIEIKHTPYRDYVYGILNKNIPYIETIDTWSQIKNTLAIPKCNNNNNKEKEEYKEKEKENEIEVNKYKSIENLKISQIYKWEDLILFWDKNKSGTKYKNKDTLDIALNKLKQISENKIEIARNIIETSIMNGWQGLFPLQNKSQVQQPKKCGIPDGII